MNVTGRVPQGVDVREYTNVGVANMVVAHNLNLDSGYTYYITIIGQLERQRV